MIQFSIMVSPLDNETKIKIKRRQTDE